ncbi:MAG TPA: 4Fe-4S dicluster domain-containing protein [Candidatus Woesearchaeota archaeon]|nr:4Fe-4S dicluster domain-containing protein [Candidatus Woesearchaeota archaeon]
MKTITIFSGKGGTGKTTVSSSLAVMLSRERKIAVADCDVDAPNLGLSLGLKEKDYSSFIKIRASEKAELIKEKCTGCKKCLNVCSFNAIKWDKKQNIPVFDDLLCEGCGTCVIVCPENAIKLRKVENATISVGKAYGFGIVSGQLKMGESGSGRIVMEVKRKAMEIARKENAELILVDSAAGIGCPVIASINGSDYVIAVTEPTPSALSDLKRGLKIVNHFGIPCGVVINKYDINKEFSNKIEKFANKNKIPILGKIPYNKEFVEALVNLRPAVVYNKKFEPLFIRILDNIKKL